MPKNRTSLFGSRSFRLPASRFPPPASRCQHHTRGSVLVLVVWTVSLLSVWVSSISSRMMTSLNTASRFERQLRAQYLTERALWHITDALAKDVTPGSDGLNESWQDDPALLSWTEEDGTTLAVQPPGAATVDGAPRYGLVDVERKINLNTAPADVLSRLFQMAGKLTQDEAAALSNAVLDWRDEDHERHDNGAEDFYYQGLESPYHCKDGPFETVEELLLVRYMTPALYARVAPLVTVYGSGQVNMNTAGAVVLRALGLSEGGALAVEIYREGEDSQPGTSDDRFFAATSSLTSELKQKLSAEDINRLQQLVDANLLDVKSTAFEANLLVRPADGREAMRAWCALTREGRVLAWREE